VGIKKGGYCLRIMREKKMAQSGKHMEKIMHALLPKITKCLISKIFGE